MYGFNEEYELLIQLAKQLQQEIYAACGDDSKVLPQVSVSFSAHAASIDVDGESLWCSEVDELDVSYEMLLSQLRNRAEYWSRFVAHPVAVDRNGVHLHPEQRALRHSDVGTEEVTVVDIFLDRPTLNQVGYWIDIRSEHGVEGVPSYCLEVVG